MSTSETLVSAIRRVGVLGAAGRMGRTTCDAVVAAPGLELVAVADPSAVGDEISGCTVLGGVADLIEVGVDVVVDFTVADASRASLPVLAAAGIHAVVGTSGLDEDDRVSLDAAFSSSACLVVPNFAIGAVLMQRFAELAAPWFDTAEIIERMRGMVAHQEVVLGTTGQTLTIRHDLIDRDGFMPGVVVAVLGVDGTGCTVGLDALLGP